MSRGAMNGEVDVQYMNMMPQHGHLHANGSAVQAHLEPEDDDLPEAESTILSCDYIRWRLQQDNIAWEDCPELPEPNRVRLTMRTLADEFEKTYQNHIQEMVNQMDITPMTAFHKFMGLMDGIFDDSTINWGRIVAMFAFGGALARQSVRNGTPQLIGNVADWVAVFSDARLTDWIQANGGWEGLVQFYEQRQTSQGTWPGWQQLAVGGSVVIVGAVALGRMLSSS